MAEQQTSALLYLIPVPLAPDVNPVNALPPGVVERVNGLRCFFVENLRSARRFLRAMNPVFPIDECEFHLLDEHTRPQDVDLLTAALLKAGNAGVISEAGCPGVADPGAMLVEQARRAGATVVPLVGPSSILLGLMASGFNGQNFAFNGYLPQEADLLTRKLKELTRRVAEGQTQIFIETPYRNNKLISRLADTLPPAMRLCVASMLTSRQEEVTVHTIAQWKKAAYDYSRKPSIFLLSN